MSRIRAGIKWGYNESKQRALSGFGEKTHRDLWVSSQVVVSVPNWAVGRAVSAVCCTRRRFQRAFEVWPSQGEAAIITGTVFNPAAVGALLSGGSLIKSSQTLSSTSGQWVTRSQALAAICLRSADHTSPAYCLSAASHLP